MINPFCIPKRDLIEIFWVKKTRDRLSKMISKFPNLSLQEIYNQMLCEKGEFAEHWIKEKDQFSKSTINQEIVSAINLADFYFQNNSNPKICFEMKKSFKKSKINNYEELIENIESDTDVDFLIGDKEKYFEFQLKTYPEIWKKMCSKAIIRYIKKDILPKYKNKNLIMVILLQPVFKSDFRLKEDIDKIHLFLKKEDVNLFQMNFILNINNDYSCWIQVFPNNGHFKIPINQLSYNQAKNKVNNQILF